MLIDQQITLDELDKPLERFFSLAGMKMISLDELWNPQKGSPVFTVRGKYTARGWTEWTQGFQFGCQLLQFDATGDPRFLEMGRANTLSLMAPHLTHTGVHDHGFNNLSSYGHLRRLTLEGRTGDSADRLALYELALKLSGAVQAARWSRLADGTGFIYSFNGPHSLFSDTIRSCRSLVLAHRLGHVLMGEGDARINLLGRAIEHIRNTSRYNVYYGEVRDSYDVPGRVVHESIFNMNDGQYRCPSTQQGYSPFSTWTRGLAWIILGATEQLEFIKRLDKDELAVFGGRTDIEAMLLRMARVTANFYINNTAADGIPYWDTGAPGLAMMPDWCERSSQPDNLWEPVDSSAATIAAQGLLRLGHYLGRDSEEGRYFFQAGVTVAHSLLKPPYLAEDPEHQGLILHSIYHRPNGWDYIPEGKSIPQGESSMWGDYHAMELGVYLKRLREKSPYLEFYNE